MHQRVKYQMRLKRGAPSLCYSSRNTQPKRTATILTLQSSDLPTLNLLLVLWLPEAAFVCRFLHVSLIRLRFTSKMVLFRKNRDDSKHSGSSIAALQLEVGLRDNIAPITVSASPVPRGICTFTKLHTRPVGYSHSKGENIPITVPRVKTS